MKPQNKITIDELIQRGFSFIGRDNHNIEVYHSYQEEKGLILKKVNNQYRIANHYSIKDYYNKESV